MTPSSNNNTVSPNALSQTVADQTQAMPAETTTSVTDENKGDSLQPEPDAKRHAQTQAASAGSADKPVEHGGRDGLDPTRYGDWEKNGRCIDF